MRIAMIGATGLVGRALAPRLAATHEVLLIGRRTAGVSGAQERIAPMSEWPALLADVQVDIAISTLGTTIKQAGSWEDFRAVDVDAVLAFARAARGAGARQFISISTAMAMPGARNRYLALKGEAERDLGDIGYERLDIVRPGLLRGSRDGKARIAERLALVASPFLDRLLRGRLDRFASIEAETVAAAMVRLVTLQARGHFIHHNRQLRALVGASSAR